MAEQAKSELRDYLRTKDSDLATVADGLWLKAIPLHDRQNRPDSNENGRRHVEMVERNIWRLLKDRQSGNGKQKVDGLHAQEIFLLSCAACCHDFDKALKSDQPLPEGFVHGEGSGRFVVLNAAILGLKEQQAKAIESAIAIHDLKSKSSDPGDKIFQEELAKINKDEHTPFGPINLQRVAVLLKVADILHCDYSRVLDIGIDVTSLKGLDRKKYIVRQCTKGWKIDGTRILIQADIDNEEKQGAFRECFTFMKDKEWKAVEDGLERNGFPHKLSCDDTTSETLKKHSPPPEVASSSCSIFPFQDVCSSLGSVDLREPFTEHLTREKKDFPFHVIYRYSRVLPIHSKLLSLQHPLEIASEEDILAQIADPDDYGMLSLSEKTPFDGEIKTEEQVVKHFVPLPKITERLDDWFKADKDLLFLGLPFCGKTAFLSYLWFEGKRLHEDRLRLVLYWFSVKWKMRALLLAGWWYVIRVSVYWGTTTVASGWYGFLSSGSIFDGNAETVSQIACSVA